MDVLEHVRDIESQTDAGAQQRIAGARAALLAVASVEAAPRRRSPREIRRRRLAWGLGGTGLVGGLTAAAIVSVIVVGSTVAPVVVPNAAAVAVLEEAAEVTLTAVDPVVEPGQYLRMELTYSGFSIWDADEAVPFNTAQLPNAEGAVAWEGTRVYYVPADRSGDWILDDTAPTLVTDAYGDQQGARDAWDALVAEFPERDNDPGGIKVMPGGISDPAEGSGTAGWEAEVRLALAELPSEPEAMLDWFRARTGDMGPDENWYLFQVIGRTLNANLLPAEVRATALRALALVPGIRVGAVDGALTTLEFPVELGGGGDFGEALVSSVTLDTASGRVVGIAESYPEWPTDILPAGEPWFAEHYTFSVVDSAPTP